MKFIVSTEPSLTEWSTIHELILKHTNCHVGLKPIHTWFVSHTSQHSICYQLWNISIGWLWAHHLQISKVTIIHGRADTHKHFSSSRFVYLSHRFSICDNNRAQQFQLLFHKRVYYVFTQQSLKREFNMSFNGLTCLSILYITHIIVCTYSSRTITVWTSLLKALESMV